MVYQTIQICVDMHVTLKQQTKYFINLIHPYYIL